MRIESTRIRDFWTDQFGHIFSDDILRTKCKSWTPEMWEQYLTSTESKICESQVDPTQFDELAEKNFESIFVNAQTPSGVVDFARVHNALAELSPRQRQVIELIFFKSMKQREVSLALRISEKRVRELKVVALKKVRNFFQKGPSHLPLSRGNKNEVLDV